MAGKRSNREILTGGKKYAAKQGKKFRVEEVVFDKSSREYVWLFFSNNVKRSDQYINIYVQGVLNRVS